MAGNKSDAEVAAVLSKISKNHLECVICHERYREPRCLHNECLHNFCERCLATYQESSGDDSFIKCPVCRKKMKFGPGSDVVASLKTNFHLVSMVEDFTLQEQLIQPKAIRVICELCTDQQEAQYRCMDCQFFICRSCQAIHQRISGTAGHDIVALDTLRSGAEGLRSNVQDEPPCEKHRGGEEELIMGATTWKFVREIYTGCSINSMATSSNDEIVVSSHGYLQVFRTTGGLERWTNKRYYGGLVATFPDGDTFCCNGMSVQLFSNSCSLLKSYAVPASVEQDGSQINLGQPVNVAYYKNQEIVISYSNWQGIVILDTSNGSTVRKIPVDIKPDFLACTSRGRILFASRKPACVECLDDNDASSLTIHPTVAGSKVICSGLCLDSRDIMYVSIEVAKEIHIHQYTSCGSFIGCFTISGYITQPVIDIVVTGNGTLVVAQQNNYFLKLFETLKEGVTL